MASVEATMGGKEPKADVVAARADQVKATEAEARAEQPAAREVDG